MTPARARVSSGSSEGRRQTAIRTSASAKLREAGVRLPRNPPLDLLLRLVEEASGTPCEGDPHVYLLAWVNVDRARVESWGPLHRPAYFPDRIMLAAIARARAAQGPMLILASTIPPSKLDRR